MIIEQFVAFAVVRPIVVRFIARLDVNEDRKVMGVTMLRREICVLCQNDSSSPHAIRVFQNRNPFHLNAKIDIGLVKDPEDIGSSDEQNCFFVFDSEEKCVWKIARQTGDYQKFLDLQSAHFSLPAALSVSCDGRELQIVTLRSLGICGAFGPKGAAQKTLLIVQLPSGIEKPLHAVETSSGHFVVLHSLVKDDNENAGSTKKRKKKDFVASKVSRDGRLVVRRFVPQQKSHELNNPRYLALGSDDRVFVADEWNDRVVLLDSDLNWIRILCPTEDEAKRTIAPHRLCYDKVEGQLIVAGLDTREGVEVYSIDRE